MSTQTDTHTVEEFLGKVASDVAATAHAATVSLGDKLGLWAALAQGPATSDELAARTGYDARYLEDWLSAQYVSGYCGRADDGRFALTEAQSAVLADPSAATYLASAETVVGVLYKDDALAAEAFQSGRGVGWHEHDGDLFSGTERLFRPGYAANLTSSWLPALDGVVERLEHGIAVADVGCGHGASTILLAQAYPNSTFAGFDYHEPSIQAARERAAEAGVGDRVRFETASADSYPGHRYGLVCIFDALHDMGDPVGVARHIRQTLTEDGSLLLVEPMAGERIEDNANPTGRLFYSVAPYVCTANARSQRGPHELGNQVPDTLGQSCSPMRGSAISVAPRKRRSIGCSRRDHSEKEGTRECADDVAAHHGRGRRSRGRGVRAGADPPGRCPIGIGLRAGRDRR